MQMSFHDEGCFCQFAKQVQCIQLIIKCCLIIKTLYSNFRNYAPPLDVKGGIITEKVFPVFSESFFWTCFGLVMYIWVLMDVTEKLAFQM